MSGGGEGRPPSLRPPRGVRIDVNLSILFTDLALLDRPAAAAAAGFDAVELWWPFERSVPPAREVDRLVEAVGSARLTLACLNLPAGDFGRDERGLLALPSREAELLEGTELALAAAARLGGRVVNALYGNRSHGSGPRAGDDRDHAAEMLARLTARARDFGIAVVVEALNPAEFPRYGLPTVAEAAELVDRVARSTGEHPLLLFDAYHVERGEGSSVERFAEHASSIGHVQVADVPGRGRPGSGRLPFAPLFEAIEDSGYRGFLGLEHLPSRDPADTFGWLRDAGALPPEARTRG